MTPGASGSAASVPPKHALLIEILDLHARGLLRMPWIQALIVLGIGLFIVPSISLSSFTLWAVSSVATEALRARYASGILRREFILSPRFAHAIFVGLASLDGLVISAGAVIFLPQLPVMHQALLGVVLFALPAAGVAVSSSRYILGAYAVCVLLPAAITWAMLHPSQSLGLAALSTAYCATIFFVSADGEKLVLRSVVVRHERDQLVRDLEQRNEQVLAAVAQAERSAQARARVLAAASHDLRQPLHALSLYSAVLAANPTQETVRELSRSVDQIVRSLGSLLNGLLDLSRLSAAHYVPEQQVLDLETLLSQVCAEYQHVAAQKQLLITHDLTPIRIACDPIAVGRIARNLMDNAIKYTERGGISVATRLEQTEAGCYVVLSVADSGRGIPAAEQERIFEEFYQIDNPGRDHGKGVGLGLAIVRRLCELIGGTVQVNSQPGQGTRFDVRFPATLVDDTIPGRTQSGELAPSFPGRRIYVVDDEPEILRSMQKLLGAWGIEVMTANSTRTSERLFEMHRQPDLMIVDLRLNEEESGVQLASRLRGKYGNFPILIVTGETSSDALAQANDLAFPLLQKPIAPEILRSAIADALAAPAP